MNLEDKIYNILQEMKECKYENGNAYYDKFKPYWVDFQDTWDDEMWFEYENYRGITKNEMTVIENDETRFSNTNIKDNNDTLDMIDKEIEKMTDINEEMYDNINNEKDRSCFKACIIY